MLKNFSIILFVLVLLLSISTVVLATDINMNLPVEEENLVSEDGNLIGGDEQATEDSNIIGNTQDDLQYSTDGVQGATDATQDDIGGDATPSSVSSIAQENMSFSNILNILIITVGVILILLAIAILVRLKS